MQGKLEIFSTWQKVHLTTRAVLKYKKAQTQEVHKMILQAS
jgi:hypothetical protein